MNFMERADAALYASKRGGRDQVTTAAAQIAPERLVSGRAA